MPNYRCTKCNRQIFDIITTDEEKNNAVELFFLRLTKKFAYFYEIKPEVKHYEIQNKDNCDGIIKLSLFDRTPETFRSINFISFLKSRDLDGLKNEIVSKIIDNKKTYPETNSKDLIKNNITCKNEDINIVNVNKNNLDKRNNIFTIFLYYFYICYVLLCCIIKSIKKIYLKQ